MTEIPRKKPYEPVRSQRDLLRIFDQLNKQYFGGTVCGGIGWRFIPLAKEAWTLAVCDIDERFIRVNVILDDKRIPVWFLKFVVYHEMLHLHLGPQQFDPDGYAYPHSDRFKSLESRHPDYQKAIDFEEEKLDKIVKSWKRWRAWNKVKRKKARKKAKNRK